MDSSETSANMMSKFFRCYRNPKLLESFFEKMFELRDSQVSESKPFHCSTGRSEIFSFDDIGQIDQCVTDWGLKADLMSKGGYHYHAYLDIFGNKALF